MGDVNGVRVIHVGEKNLNRDYWTEFEDSPSNYALNLDEIRNIVPLSPHQRSKARAEIPDLLAGALFGAPDGMAASSPGSSPEIATYAILDAAKITMLPDILEASGLEHRCLFTGNAGRELGSVAPWMVKLERESDFTRDLLTHSDAPRHYWGNEAGIFVRSACDLNETWRHFRKFTRLQDEDGKWLFFRFWEPLPVAAYMRSLAFRPSEAGQWFGAGTVGSILVPLVRDQVIMRVRPDAQIMAQPARPVILNDSDRMVLSGARTKWRLNMLSDLLAKSFPDINTCNRDELDSLVLSTVQRMQYYGIRQAKSLFTTCAWELAHGPKFEDQDQKSVLREIFLSQRDEAEKMNLLRTRMAELSLPVRRV